MNPQMVQMIQSLVEKGVTVPIPETVEIGGDVDPSRISAGVTIYAGCKIYGSKTLIMPGAKLGYESPVTIENCQIGSGVELKGGFFRKSVFLDRAAMGSGAQVRDGCILEEEANGAHAVGLKQTILFPFVTLGSLINFCDCLMAGGTSRKNHSEVGSSYIHFNYTPNQDKATASLVGDVPRGVMLNQNPIFLGGQGGLVGPSRLGYGTVIAAGAVYRGDCPEGGKLMAGSPLEKSEYASYPGLYWNVARRTINNLYYIANLMALRQWYLGVRSQFMKGDSMASKLYEGILEKTDMALEERIERLRALAAKMPESARKYLEVSGGHDPRGLIKQKNELFEEWQKIEDILRSLKDYAGKTDGDLFLEAVAREKNKKGNDYIMIIQGLSEKTIIQGTAWLQGIVDKIVNDALELVPSIKVAHRTG